MIKIVKDGKGLTVPTSAYKNFYKNAGWSVADASGVVQPDPSEDAEWDEVLTEEEQEPTKPLSEMNRGELERLAEQMGISLAGLSNTRQIREALKAAM